MEGARDEVEDWADGRPRDKPFLFLRGSALKGSALALGGSESAAEDGAEMLGRTVFNAGVSIFKPFAAALNLGAMTGLKVTDTKGSQTLDLVSFHASCAASRPARVDGSG